MEVRRELAETFLSEYEPSLVQADVGQLSELVEVMKFMENENDWRVSLAGQAAMDFHTAGSDSMGEETDLLGGLFGGGFGPMRLQRMMR